MWSQNSVHPFLAATSQNAHLRASCQEYVCRGNGAVVLTFPYTVGSYKLQPACDWKYNNGSPVRNPH